MWDWMVHIKLLIVTVLQKFPGVFLNQRNRDTQGELTILLDNQYQNAIIHHLITNSALGIFHNTLPLS